MNEPRADRPESSAPVVFRLDDLAFCRIGGRVAFFSEDRQAVFEQDEVSTYLSCRLIEGASQGTLERELAERGLSAADAERHVRHSLGTWSDLGVLRAEFGGEPGEGRRIALGLAGRRLALDFRDARSCERLAPLYARLLVQTGEDAGPTIRIASMGRSTCIASADDRALIVPDDMAAPALKAAITEAVLGSLGEDVALHAAMLVRQGQAVLVCGAPGAGKSTLAMALCERGFALAGDDIALLDGRGLLRGLSFAPTLKEGAWRLSEGLADKVRDRPTHRRPDGQRVRFVEPPAFAGEGPWPAARLLLLRREEGAATRLASVDPVEALSQVLSGAFTPAGRLTRGQFERLVRLVAQARPAALHYEDADSAAEAIEAHHG